jgi:hypothetical protein
MTKTPQFLFRETYAYVAQYNTFAFTATTQDRKVGYTVWCSFTVEMGDIRFLV